jgi:hypothetical protein
METEAIVNRKNQKPFIVRLEYLPWNSTKLG